MPSYVLKLNVEIESDVVRADALPVGTLAVVVSDAMSGRSLKGKLLLKTFSAVVLLNDPEITWSDLCKILCRPLQPGESVTLTVKE